MECVTVEEWPFKEPPGIEHTIEPCHACGRRCFVSDATKRQALALWVEGGDVLRVTCRQCAGIIAMACIVTGEPIRVVGHSEEQKANIQKLRDQHAKRN